MKAPLSLDRRYGWLVHLPCLPAPDGIGDFAAAAQLIDVLQAAGATLWQLLPLHPPGYGNSPYAAFSAFALDPLLISLQWLQVQDLLPPSLSVPPPLPKNRIDVTAVAQWKYPIFREAYERWRYRGERTAFERFYEQERFWLEDFTLFWLLKQLHNHQPWHQWEPEARNREESFLRKLKRTYTQQLEFFAFLQWIAAQQLDRVRHRARQAGVLLIGDLPLFVAYDSADVWAHPHLFKLDRHKRPTVVAGVPPDYFSPTGQRWGNPHYRWQHHRRERFQWWTRRLRRLLQWFDYVRIDHFRGLAAVWEIPASAPDARTGRWVRTPGASLFRHWLRTFKTLPLLAEDLGTITPDVIKLRDRFGIPGMKVLQFGLESADPAHPFLPQNFDSPLVVFYTGTHDNDTAVGWLQTMNPSTRQFIQALAQRDDLLSLAEWMIDQVLFSTARFAIIPLQDILHLSSDARLNTPGRAEGNWIFRFAALPSPDRLSQLKHKSFLANRLPAVTSHQTGEKPDSAGSLKADSAGSSW